MRAPGFLLALLINRRGRHSSCQPASLQIIPLLQANATFIEDPEMAQRLMDANPNSFRKLVSPGVGVGAGCPGADPARRWLLVPCA